MPTGWARRVSRRVAHIVGHPSNLDTKRGDLLADLTTKGLVQIALCLQDDVTLEGEVKALELKVVG